MSAATLVLVVVALGSTCLALWGIVDTVRQLIAARRRKAELRAEIRRMIALDVTLTAKMAAIRKPRPVVVSTGSHRLPCWHMDCWFESRESMPFDPKQLYVWGGAGLSGNYSAEVNARVGQVVDDWWDEQVKQTAAANLVRSHAWQTEAWSQPTPGGER